MSTLAVGIAVLFFAVGAIGIVFPIIPGIALIWLGMLVYGFLTGFETLTLAFFLGQAVGVALAFVVDYAANVWGVKRFGGSKAALWGSVIGILFGVLLLGPFGVIVGPFAGALAGELLAGGSPSRAVQVGIGTLIGFLGGTVLKFGIATVMIIWFFTVIL
ncbi:MAG: DUF456 domain-containing protein [Eubacteriales bacterium]|nr:DUF456 domain-containing protein [Bacillota bacterium]MBV1727467.1 DUF456 domain-containing protein [Desulforudis sp.]MDQ7789802.1 DUF456 domain-containing protein [Clostridia bacterium]MDZ4043643.1 DUF456 domain-containing protein [Eubacteriales bacterium]MBU4532941.1 DUF456 domain-containing protein [Bacillota bacterium]